MPTPIPKPPGHLKLRGAGRALWREITTGYDLEPHHLTLLDAACSAAARMDAARSAIAEHGLTFVDDKGGIHPRPEVAIERDSRLALVRCLRELSLDSAAAESAARPPQIAKRYA